MSLDEKEIMVTTYTNGSAVIHMTLVHLPTGKRVSGEGHFRHQLRKKLINRLEWDIAGEEK